MNLRVGTVVVTHNSQKVINRCIHAIHKQTYTIEQIVIVDSGSEDIHYLEHLQDQDSLTLVSKENIGFAKANNAGLKVLAKGVDIVVFLNPDTFLTPTFIEEMVQVFQSNSDVGVLSGKLLGYNITEERPNGRLDSCGIFRKWYGRWYDRGQGEIEGDRYSRREHVPALCGALFCIRVGIIDQLGGELFDPDFFMYKEDIELSIRLRKLGYKLHYHPELVAYHCRGWQRSRKNIDQQTKQLASKNEILLYKKHPSPYLIWALFKYSLVRIFKL